MISQTFDKQPRALRVISRKSPLAVAQTEIVIEQIRKSFPGLEFTIEKIETSGDVNLQQALPLIGGKGVFTQELERALLEGRADIAVHSLKDLPLDLPAGLTIGACLPREDPSDVVVFPDASDKSSLEQLEPGSIIGTSSLRRKFSIKHFYPHLEVIDIRGNLQTRLDKLNGRHMSNQKYDALVLALAGIKRSGCTSNYKVLSDEKFMHAPGQGFLAVECRNEGKILDLLRCLRDPISEKTCLAERSILAAIGGGCHTPLGVFTMLDGHCLSMKAVVYNAEGHIESSGEEKVVLDVAETLGPKLAQHMSVPKST